MDVLPFTSVDEEYSHRDMTTFFICSFICSIVSNEKYALNSVAFFKKKKKWHYVSKATTVY